MEIVILAIIMSLVGVLIGVLAGVIWKGERPLGVAADYIIAIVVTVAIGLLDWFVIPAMGFSDTMKYLGIVFEPALGALFVLWLIRKARQS
jgi:uncharacterized membrane protein YeaQ/YmgE (transglycosylase-associated protein family)